MNTVRHENERSGSLFSRNEADLLNSFIDSSSLIDLPIGGRYYTRMNKVEAPNDGRILKSHEKLSLGFGSKRRSWIRVCLQSSRASILINGSPTSKFSIKRGLRQGDPLSPLLFILAMEGLHGAMSNAVNSGLIRGLKINIHKSNIYDIGVSNDEVSSMASRTGCAAGSFPFIYLGLPIGSNMNLMSSWNILVDRGLNIGSLKTFNLALLQKWHWRLFSSSNAHWVKVINVLHGQEGGMDHQGCSFNDTWWVATYIFVSGKIYGLAIPLSIFDTIGFIDWNKTKTVLSLIVLLMVNDTGTGLGLILAFETWLT
ncbi:putative RNA-directed DNA polymerase, eukaryota, reverse transcriptase zinc-binding domain protein [Tanacetum coccineum]|uniref:RNA-directed DNA polymerase, eukaryota, reverse transcriptase zinc-binding domain protein n=1 Tax=Tanacetum coccineum TaxID=301880 RepID=A0ABQ5ATT0_9ASTR